MEILFLVGLTLAAKAGWDHAWERYRQSSAARVQQAQKAIAPKALPKSEQARIARRHRFGWWTAEAARGFPVTRTGFHAGWLAHRTVLDNQKAKREEARTSHLDTRAAILLTIPAHRKRQAQAQARIDEALAKAERETGKPVRGRKGVRSAVSTLRRKDGTPVWEPPAGAPPVTPAETPGGKGVTGTAGDPPAGAGTGGHETPPPEEDGTPSPDRPSSWLEPGEPPCEGCGGTGSNADRTDACPACRGFGSAAPDPAAPEMPDGTICRACGRPGTPEDPVLDTPGSPVHRSHAARQAAAYHDALTRMRASRQPQGAPMADTNYDAALKLALETSVAAEEVAATARLHFQAAEEYLATARKRRTEAEAASEEMQALEVDAASLDEWLNLVTTLQATEKAAQDSSDAAAASEKAAAQSAEAAAAVVTGLQRRHSGVAAAVAEAPVPRTAVREFYEEG